MGYIEFEKSRLVNLEYSLSKEILRTSGTGSYSSTTIVGCNTRKYHGLLVSPVDKFDGERFVLLSSFDVSIVQGAKIFNIGLHKYDADHYSPKGHKYLTDFKADPFPSMKFEVGNVSVSQERVLSSNDDQLLIRFTLMNSPGDVKFQFRPVLAYRKIHELTEANMYLNRTVNNISNGISMQLYKDLPTLNLQCSKMTDFVSVPDWLYGVEYPEEQQRGYDFKEDLFMPGFFELSLKEGESIVFSASTVEVNPAGLKKRFAAETKIRIPRDNFRNCLINAAEQFIVRRKGQTDIIAGYHWFGSWGRDTFISLPGLTLSLGNRKTCSDVLDTQVARMKNGLFPNMGTPGNPAFNSVDAPLWFVWAVQQFYLAGAHDAWKKYAKAVKSVVSAYLQGTSFNIGADESGLIYARSEGKALTWMDAVTENGPVTQRGGYNVEINALWFNAVSFVLEMEESVPRSSFVREYKDLPDKIRESFLRLFWDEKAGYLADYVEKDGTPNMFVRPNMVIAASLPYRMVSAEMSKRILDRVESELLTPRGLRTLSPKNSFYKGFYGGSQFDRDSAYHQGTVWPWLIGPYCEALLRLYGNNALDKVIRIISGFEEVMMEHGISTISEVYSGDPPHIYGGTISQAWSVAEVLRVMDMIDQAIIKREVKK
jgi:predicted glycogen debranching enzyme